MGQFLCITLEIQNAALDSFARVRVGKSNDMYVKLIAWSFQIESRLQCYSRTFYPQFYVKSTQFKKLATNALQFTY